VRISLEVVELPLPVVVLDVFVCLGPRRLVVGWVSGVAFALTFVFALALALAFDAFFLAALRCF